MSDVHSTSRTPAQAELTDESVFPVPSISQFEALARQWRSDTRFASSTTEIAMHPAYQRIIGLGPAAVPFILAELRREPGPWFWALAAITGADPVPQADRGKLDSMTQAWLAWGEAQGFAKP
jgi:hypothetical protein